MINTIKRLTALLLALLLLLSCFAFGCLQFLFDGGFAIVEIENIVRHVKMGKSPYRASLEAADEIGLAVIAISTYAGVKEQQLTGFVQRLLFREKKKVAVAYNTRFGLLDNEEAPAEAAGDKKAQAEEKAAKKAAPAKAAEKAEAKPAKEESAKATPKKEIIEPAKAAPTKKDAAPAKSEPPKKAPAHNKKKPASKSNKKKK